MNYFECCHGCVSPKRYPGCSGKCPDYAEARAKYDADKAKQKKDRQLHHYYIERTLNVNDCVSKYKRRRPKKRYRK